MLPLQLVKDKKTLYSILSTKKPSFLRILYRQLEWRRIKMDSFCDDKILEMNIRRKKLLKQNRKEIINYISFKLILLVIQMQKMDLKFLKKH